MPFIIGTIPIMSNAERNDAAPGVIITLVASIDVEGVSTADDDLELHWRSLKIICYYFILNRMLKKRL